MASLCFGSKLLPRDAFIESIIIELVCFLCFPLLKVCSICAKSSLLCLFLLFVRYLFTLLEVLSVLFFKFIYSLLGNTFSYIIGFLLLLLLLLIDFLGTSEDPPFKTFVLT